MRFARWTLHGVALLSIIVAAVVGWFFFRDLAGAHTFGVWHGLTFITSGEGRLVICSSIFHTGTFSPHYTTLLALSGVLPFLWLGLLAGQQVWRGRPGT